MFKTIEKCAIIFLIIVLLGFILMCVTYTLPTDNARANIMKDTGAFDELYPEVIPNDKTTVLDGFTDSKIIMEVLDKNEYNSPIKNAMAVYSASPKDFNSFMDGDLNVTWEYPRYWHGNLVAYSILLNFFDYSGIKIINLFCELVLIIGIIKLMIDNDLKNYVLPFAISLLFIHPEVIGQSLQFTPVFYIMLISIYVLLKFKDKLFENDNLIYYFLIIGMSTAFFDYLTYPLVTLGGPLIFYLLIEDNKQSLKENIFKLLLLAFVWAFGYIGMWVSKWIIASVVLNKNVIASGLNVIALRSSSVDGVPRYGALLKNILIYNNSYYIVIMGAIIIYYIVRLIKIKEDISFDKLRETIPFLLIAITPFLWYLFASNHSFIHYWMTYRIMFIFFFAILCSLEYLIRKKEVMHTTHNF